VQSVFVISIVPSDTMDVRNKKCTAGKEVLAGLDRLNMKKGE